jgi:hypothetical protein
LCEPPEEWEKQYDAKAGGSELEEKDLSKRQKRWLEASRKIGRGAMTKTERETLERLYAEMLPAEQQELARFIQEKYGQKEPEKQSAGGSGQEAPQEEDPIERMQRKVWAEPSAALRSALADSIAPKKKPSKDQS